MIESFVVVQQNYAFDYVYKVFYLFKMISLRSTANNLVFQPNEAMTPLKQWINFSLPSVGCIDKKKRSEERSE